MRKLTSLAAAAILTLGLVAPASAAAPVENEWATSSGERPSTRAPASSLTTTAETTLSSRKTPPPEPSVHINLHLEAIGESSGDAYVYNTTINSPVHVAADGSDTADQLVNFVLVSKGSSPNMRITFRLHQVFASDGTLISETSDFSLDCRGS